MSQAISRSVPCARMFINGGEIPAASAGSNTRVATGVVRLPESPL